MQVAAEYRSVEYKKNIWNHKILTFKSDCLTEVTTHTHTGLTVFGDVLHNLANIKKRQRNRYAEPRL